MEQELIAAYDINLEYSTKNIPKGAILEILQIMRECGIVGLNITPARDNTCPCAEFDSVELQH